MNGYVKGFLCFVLVGLILTLSLNSLASASAYEADSRIGDADKSICQAFEAVLDAERAGANVSILVARLNEAGAFLAEAENLYRNGNFTGAISLADKASALAGDVKNDSLSLQSRALAESKKSFCLTILSSLSAASVFLIILGIVWVFFKRFYVRRILKMKPEVAASHAET